MRARGDKGTQVFTADSMAEQFGVNKGSYESVHLPKLSSHKVVPCLAPSSSYQGRLPSHKQQTILVECWSTRHAALCKTKSCGR